jgi:sugar lactone lactonase YvrE
MDVRVAVDARDRLGESPVWDDARDELVWVDITGRRVHRWSPATGASAERATDGDVGAVALTDRDGVLLVAVERELRLLADDGSWTTVASVPGTDDVRFNDCRSDPHGRLWAGTMSRTRSAGRGALYRHDGDGTLATVLESTTISNGLGWSPDGTTMYFIDSPTQRIDAFDFDTRSGAISERRPLATVAAADGLPDGLTVDSEGCIWVCLFGGGAVRRYTPAGELVEHLRLPVTNPTCPAFAGAGSRTLYVTSASHRLSAEQLAREPLAGAVLALEVPAMGRGAHRLRL